MAFGGATRPDILNASWPTPGGVPNGGTAIAFGGGATGCVPSPVAGIAFPGLSRGWQCVPSPGAGFAFGTKGVGFIGTGALAGTSGGLGALAGNIGIMLVLSGVAGLLTPVPKTPKSEEDPQNSFSFSGIQQTSRAGTAVPVCYGEILTGSVVISAEIDVSEQAT